jgi:hypothetical protein
VRVFFRALGGDMQTHSTVRSVLVIFTLSACCPAGQVDPRELVRQSIQNGQQSLKVAAEYACTKQVVERQFDTTGAEKSAAEDEFSIIPLGYGASFEEPSKHNGAAVSAEVRQRAEKELDKMRNETPAAKQRRFEKDLAERAYMNEVPDAFDFRITRTEDLPTGPTWVVEATPRPGYEPESRYARVFAKMRGTLWIDQKDIQWVKADAVAVENVSFGLVIARLSKGSHILLEQVKLPSGDWLPKSLSAKAGARLFMLFAHNFEENITYNNYRKAPAVEASAR